MSKNSDFYQAFVRLRSKPTGEWLAPPELRPRLVADAEADGSNLTEVVVGILSRRYGVSFSPNGRRTAPAGSAEELNLRLPMPLKRKIAAVANVRDRTLQEQIRHDLADHYGLAMPVTAAA